MERRKLMVQKPQDLRNNMVVSFLSFLMASILWTMDCRCLQSGMANRHRQGKKSSKKSLLPLGKGAGKGWPSRREHLFDNTHPTPANYTTPLTTVPVGPNRELIFHSWPYGSRQ